MEINNLHTITEDEIISIDNRIKSCIIQNPEDDYIEYYVKIWFNYRFHNGKIQPDGRTEFISTNKIQLILDIQNFLNEKKDGWIIV